MKSVVCAFEIQQYFHRCVLHKIHDRNAVIDGLLHIYVVRVLAVGFVESLNQSCAADEFHGVRVQLAPCTFYILSLSYGSSA